MQGHMSDEGREGVTEYGHFVCVDLNLRDNDNCTVGVGVHPKPPDWADDSYEGSLKSRGIVCTRVKKTLLNDLYRR